ncbi:MAG: hypothetical protein ACRC8S_12490 [Fimbriiglobus sp.]
MPRDAERLMQRFLTGLPYLITGLALGIGVPWFIHMPPWCDLTLYDLAATNIRSGGVHYRDIFDTNLPGFVWCLTLINMVLGNSVEAVRAVDLGIVAGITWLLVRFARIGGANNASVAWLVAGVALFYPHTGEMNHAQRDVWMMLPILLAIRLRLLKRGPFWQGVLWGCAVWIKPHAIMMAAVVWCVGWPQFSTMRERIYDWLWNFAGGAIIGGAGLIYLIQSGTWPHFVEVFTFWNTGYLERIEVEIDYRLTTQFMYFPPWSYLHLIAIPIGLKSVWDSHRDTSERGQARRFVVYLYFIWATQALFVQRAFHYVHIPEVLLMLTVAAQVRVWLGGLVALFLATTSLIIGLGWHPDDTPHPGHMSHTYDNVWCVQHPLVNTTRLAVWPDCFRWQLTEKEYYDRQQALSLNGRRFPNTSNEWDELQELAEELRRWPIRDGELLAWDDLPHAIYPMLGVRPTFRFLHVRSMMFIGSAQEGQIRREAEATNAKYILADLMALMEEYPEEYPNRKLHGADLLPPLSPAARARYPYSLKAIYRTRGNTGRYIIFERPR